MSQAPQLERSEMSAAEHANQKLAEQIMVLMAKALRESAKRYPPKLRNALSDPTSETKLEISFGGEKAYSAALGPNNQIKATYINSISDSQARFLQEALSKSKGESLNSSMVRDMRVLVNGKPLFQMKNGNVIQNDLPPSFSKAIADMVKPRPLEVSLATGLSEPNLSRPDPEGRNAYSASGAVQPETTGKKSFNRGSSSLGRSLKELGIPSQQELNRQLMAEARKSLERLVPNQPVGNRQWNHDRYTISEKQGVTSVFIAETKETVTQHGNSVTGQARQKDVNALRQVNTAIAQQMGKSHSKGTEAEL